MTQALVPTESIERSILVIRGHKVMLDSDLAKLYGVETKILLRAVRRNLNRFPGDFMFQLTDEEWEILRIHFGTSNNPAQDGGSQRGRGGRRYNPYVFTEHGLLMLANVLNSDRAIGVSIEIVRAFIRLRQLMTEHEELKQRILEMEQRYDKQFAVVFDAIMELMQPPEQPTRQIGFRVEE